MVFTNVSRPRQLCITILQCEGAVYYKDKNGAYRDMKSLAEQLLALSDSMDIRAISQIEILAEAKQDRDKLFNFMFQSAA